jgi:RHS repeat-associated protein
MRIILPAYTPYGHGHTQVNLAPILGFNGDRYDALTGMYALGQGLRSYSPALMRFCRPDQLSPFAEGGYNAYAYCAGDPLNYRDDTGQSRVPSRKFTRLRNMWEDRSSQPVQKMAPPKKKSILRMTHTPEPKQEHRAPRDPVIKFDETVTIMHYTKEQIALKDHYATDKRLLRTYIQELTAYKNQKFQDLVYLSSPEAFNQANNLRVTPERYDKAMIRLAKSIENMEERLSNLNKTLRSYRIRSDVN